MAVSRNFVFKSILRATNSIVDFFDTAPDLMSDETARKLRDDKESRELIEEIRIKRDRNKAHYSVEQ